MKKKIKRLVYFLYNQHAIPEKKTNTQSSSDLIHVLCGRYKTQSNPALKGTQPKWL
jgi:hypothetical protein